MSEDLVLFRDNDGQLGLIGLYCSHRRADLSYGRVEDGGLRCLYHGWLFDRQAAASNSLANRRNGVLRESSPSRLSLPGARRNFFAYLGPGEPPLFPNYEPFLAPAGHVLVSKFYHECNYFQGNEGNLDPSHVSYLHRQANVPENLKRTVNGSDGKLPLALYEVDVAPESKPKTPITACAFFPFGSDDGRIFFRVTNFVFPNMATIPGPMSGDGYNLYCHVPIDDMHHWRYDFVFRRSAPMEEKDIERDREILNELTPGHRPKRNKSNRYLQDRESMKSWSSPAWDESSTCRCRDRRRLRRDRRPQSRNF